MNLQKKIVYIDYIENGEKLKNAGHIKLWIRDNSCVLDIHIKGLYQTDTMMAEMRGIGRDSVVGRICIDKGAAYFNGSFPVDDMDGEGNGFYDLEGISIRISDTRVLEARWKEERPAAGPVKKEPVVLKAASSPAVETKIKMPEERPVKTGGAVVQFPFKMAPEPSGEEKNREKIPDQSKIPEPEKEEILFPDKWEQLRHIYPVIHPFTTQEYLKIEPKDFTILRKEYQQLVNNSFLLHGFYNYRHLILGKEMKRDREVYYLGVPGTYYEREKMVAVMFGFESFEVSEQEFSQGFIPEGTFGYYLRTVEI